MRNRRLLTLAVLAVAIGFAAYAQAAIYTPPPPYYGTAVVTLIRQTEFDLDGNSTFDVNVRLWDDAGIGEPAVDTAGLIDFNIASITGGTSGAVVKNISVTAPLGEVTGDINTYGAGFTTELIKSSGGSFDVSCPQPVMYNGTGTNEPLRDAAILIGVGTTGYGGDGEPQNKALYPAGYFSVDPGAYAGDTPIIHGIYSGDGVLGTITFGVISFSVLPNEAGVPFVGPMADIGTSTSVKAVVIQTTTLAGNDGGGAASANPTNLKVEFGSVVLGGAYASGPNVTLQVSDANTSVTMGTDHTFGGLNITGTGTPGQYRGVNVDSSLITVMDADPANKAGELRALVVPDAGATTDGLYSSQVNLANEVLVVTAVGTDHVAIKATIQGDINLDGTVDFGDYTVMSLNWQKARDQWSQADLNGDAFVDFGDYTVLSLNWQKSFTPTGEAPPIGVPEPATMALLGLGALGLLRRHRRS